MNSSDTTSNFDGASSTVCSTVLQPSTETCDLHKCAFGGDDFLHAAEQPDFDHPTTATCISCSEYLNPTEDSDTPSDLSHLAYYAMLGGGALLLKKYIKNKIISKKAIEADAKLGSNVFEKIAGQIVEEAEMSLERSTEEIAERGGVELAEEGVDDAVTAVFPPVGLALKFLNYAMLESMAADVVDTGGYRTYVANRSQIDKRNGYDHLYIRHISDDTDTDSQIPLNQPPSIYQLELLIYPLKDSKIPEAKILYRLALGYVEAKVHWINTVLNMSCNVLESNGAKGKYDEFIEIQRRGEKAGYDGIAVLQQGSPLGCHPVATANEYDDNYRGGYCIYELELYKAFDSFINHLSLERDASIMNYIEEYMKEFSEPADVMSALQTNTQTSPLTKTNLWNSPLGDKSDEIIHTGITGSKKYLVSDLITNYSGLGTEKISGVSLTEAGCILLNQILDWESYIYTFSRDVDGDPTGISPGIPDTDLQGLLSYKMPKAAFSDYHRVISQISLLPEDKNPVKLTSEKNVGGIKLPLYYPSHSPVEISCKYGWEAVKLRVGEGSVKTTMALDYMAGGDGTGGDIDSAWLPLLFGVSYDESIGACKYDPAGGSLGVPYCRQMGRGNSGITVDIFENDTTETAGGSGIKYMSCDEDDVPGWAELTIGREHYRDFMKWKS
jgi:hypothetical protein